MTHSRKIIRIDEAKCNGCGKCVTACAEGALQLINGKARLVKDEFCDGLGACIGDCPTGALTIEERPAADFNERAALQHVAKLKHSHGCPGMREMNHAGKAETRQPATALCGSGLPPQVNPSDLRQWPVQLHLVRPGAEFFKKPELVLLSTCAPTASADVHWRYIRGRAIVVACPKLDRTEGYVEKLAGILAEPAIQKLLVVRMEVPCCGGLLQIAATALEASGRGDIDLVECKIGLQGDCLSETVLRPGSHAA